MSDKGTISAKEMQEITEALVISSLRGQEKAEEAVQSLDLLRTLVDELDAVIWEVDVDTWQFSFVSQRVEHILGYPGDRWLSERDFWVTVIHPLDRMQTLETWRTGIREASQFSLEYRAMATDGRVVWLRNIVSVNRDAGRRPQKLSGVMIDITQRHEAEANIAVAFLREHRIAETLQRSMLLKPGQGQFPGLEVETFYEPCWDEALVGGDFFDAFVPSPGKVALVVGDVCGKGLIAAARTVQVKYALRAFLHDECPEAAMSHLNRYLTAGLNAEGNDGEFIALCLAVLDQASGEAILVNAGAEQALLLRPENEVLSVDVGGLPLGVSSDATYAPGVLNLVSGDTLLMMSDGITEARHGCIFLGAEGVAQMAQASFSLDLNHMGQALFDGARTFGQGKFRDDVCMVLARKR